MTCPYCGKDARLVDSAAVYGRSYGWAWVCSDYPKCDSYCGCHPGTKNPLGTLANKGLRNLRNAAHRSFDDLWHRKMNREGCEQKVARTAGYKWLSEKMGIPKEQTHIAMFTQEQCWAVIELCAPYRPQRGLVSYGGWR